MRFCAATRRGLGTLASRWRRESWSGEREEKTKKDTPTTFLVRYIITIKLSFLEHKTLDLTPPPRPSTHTPQ